jgi:hypothetical protein
MRLYSAERRLTALGSAAVEPKSSSSMLQERRRWDPLTEIIVLREGHRGAACPMRGSGSVEEVQLVRSACLCACRLCCWPAPHLCAPYPPVSRLLPLPAARDGHKGTTPGDARRLRGTAPERGHAAARHSGPTTRRPRGHACADANSLVFECERRYDLVPGALAHDLARQAAPEHVRARRRARLSLIFARD